MNYIKMLEDNAKIHDRIEFILKDDKFEVSTRYLLYIHELLFKGILFENGKVRKHNLNKEQDILNWESVDYPDYNLVYSLLKMTFDKEKHTDHSNQDIDTLCDTITKFWAELWFIHPFGEGNTRTTTVFMEKYLQSLGYNLDNMVFKNNAKYFRDSLVRANYSNETLGIEKYPNAFRNFVYNAMANTPENINFEDLYICDRFAVEDKNGVKRRRLIRL